MRMKRRGVWENLIRLTGIVIVLGGLFVLPVSAQEVLPNLFSEADLNAPQMDLPADYTGEVIRARWTAVDFGVVAQMARSGPRQDGDDQPDFTFNFFPDVSYPAYIQGVEEMLNGAVGIYGRVSQGAVSEFVLVVNNGLMHGYLQDGLDTYEVRYQNGGHLIVEVDSSRYPDSLPPVPAIQTDAGAVVQAEAIPQADTADYIDVLGVYTSAARIAAGGAAAIEARIQASIESTNLGYANSGVNQQVRLVGMEEVAYDQSIPANWATLWEALYGNPPSYYGMDENRVKWNYTLYRLAFGYWQNMEPSANYLASVRSARDAYGADLVFMLTDLPYSYCGLGFIGGDPGDAAVGYSVEHWYCSGSTSYTVQHEMGHNMGACHDRANSSIICYADYSYGYQQLIAKYYTVMAYACQDCYRINQWSNPNIYYDGYATGIEVGLSNAAYNTLTLNNTAINVANYRQSVSLQASFTPAGNYDILGYRTATLNVEAVSPGGSIVQVTYEAYFNGSWHTLTVDTNPADGWAYTWTTFPLRGQLVSIRATAVDNFGREGTTQINDVLVDYGLTTVGGYTARVGERGAVNQLPDLSELPEAFFLNPIPVEEGALADFTAQFWPVTRVPQGKMPLILLY